LEDFFQPEIYDRGFSPRRVLTGMYDRGFSPRGVLTGMGLSIHQHFSYIFPQPLSFQLNPGSLQYEAYSMQTNYNRTECTVVNCVECTPDFANVETILSSFLTSIQTYSVLPSTSPERNRYNIRGRINNDPRSAIGFGPYD